MVLCKGLAEQARHEHMSDEYKPVNYCSVAVAHILGLPDQHEITTLVPSKLTKRGKSSEQALISQTRIVDPNYGNNHIASYWLVYPHFGIDLVQPPRFLNSEHHSGFQTANVPPTGKCSSSLVGRYPYHNGYLVHFISTCRLKIYRKTSYSDDHVRVVMFLVRASRILICRLQTNNFDILH